MQHKFSTPLVWISSLAFLFGYGVSVSQSSLIVSGNRCLLKCDKTTIRQWGGYPGDTSWKDLEPISSMFHYNGSFYVSDSGKVFAWSVYKGFFKEDSGSYDWQFEPRVIQPISNASKVAAGNANGDFLVFIDRNGDVFSYGFNWYGSLGVDTTDQATFFEPLKVLLPTKAVDVQCTYSTFTVLLQDSTVWSWGYARLGSTGRDTSKDQLPPGQVPVINGIVAISTANSWNPESFHVLALKSDGTVWAWGPNKDGLLGDGTTHLRETPVQVVGLNDIVAISCSGSHNLALSKDGTVWAWGNNLSGQLGNGNRIESHVPVMVKGLPRVKEIHAGSGFSIVIAEDDSWWGWGSNYYGNLYGLSRHDRISPEPFKNPCH